MGIPESFKVGWYPPKKTGSSHLKLAHGELEKAQQKGKHYYARKFKVRKFQPSDKEHVLLHTDHDKLLMQRKGPFGVISDIGSQ